MSGPTVGITVLIVLGFTILSQLLQHGVEHRRPHQELRALLGRLEAYLRK